MTELNAVAHFRQAAGIPEDAPKGLATSEQTWGHYRAEHAAFKDADQRKYKDTKAAQQHADEICDKEGLPRVKVRAHRAQQANYSRYDSKLWVKPERKYMPVVSLGKASYNEGTLIHELAHHKHLTSTFPDGEVTPEGREKYFADDEGGHGGDFQQHYHQMISDHHSGGQGFADSVRGHAQEGGFWKASALQAELTGEEGPDNQSVLCPSPADGGHQAVAHFRQAAWSDEEGLSDKTRAAVDQAEGDWHTHRQYLAEDHMNKQLDPEANRLAHQGHAQRTADKITDAEGLPRIKVLVHSSPNVSGHGTAADGSPVIALGENSLNHSTLIHELTHHKRQPAEDDPDHSAGGFYGDYIGMLQRHHPDPEAWTHMMAANKLAVAHMRNNPDKFPPRTAPRTATADGPKTYKWTQTYQGPNGYEDREQSVQGPLYHGGGARLRDGQQIKPGRKPNAWGDEHGKSEHVFFTRQKDTAASYAQQSGGHVFEVEPTGDFRMDHNEGDFKTKHPLNVVRRLDPSEWSGEQKTSGLTAPRTATAFFAQAGQSGELPEGLSFKYYGPGHFPSVGNRPFHYLVAHHPDAPDKAWPNQAGHLVWWGPDGGIDSVNVHPDFRRRGVATELWNRAKEMEPRLHHSTLQTEDGKAWAPHVSSKHTATAFFAQATTEGYTPTTQKEGEHGTDEPRRSAGDPAPRGHAGRPAAGQPEPASLHRREASAEGVERHPELQGDLDRLGGGARHVQDTVSALDKGGSGVTTYPLSHPLDGWHAALTSGGHQVVHRHDPDTGTLHVGYAGHNISDAEQRLGGASEGSKALPVDFHGGAEKDFDKLHPEVQDKVLNTIDRLSRGESHQHDHALNGKQWETGGWRSARADFRHRVTHRFEDEDGNPTSHEKASRLFIGHVGPHNYEAAEKRLSALTATTYFKQAVEGDTPKGTDNEGHPVELDPIDGWHHADGSVSHDDGTTISDHPVKTVSAMRQTAGVDRIDLYHRTTPEAAASIYREKRMISKENGPVFFSNFRGHEPDAQGNGYGEGVVHVRVPEHLAQLDDEFSSGEQHYQVHNKDLRPEHFIEDHAPKQASFQETLLAEAAAVDNSGGVMVALVPPREIAEQLVMKDGQPVDDLHVTLAYLGKASDYTPEQLKLLPQIISSWALRQKPVSLRIGGTGKFNNSHKGQHVLYAAVDIPGGAQMHADLARYLQGHGYALPSEHGWTPHLTLAYVDRHFRFMPHLDEHRWTAEHVVTEVGRTRHQARLGTIPSGRHAL